MSSVSFSESKHAFKPPEHNTPPPPPAPPPLYTTFTPRQKYLLTLLLGLTTITSPLTATIYFPLLPLLENHYHASAQAINFTITTYIIFQALSPAIFAPLSDSIGRRIIYLLTLTLYALSNLGLALQHNSYAGLLVLRALQSLGASAAFAISYGVVADVCVPAERGRMVGPVSMALNLGTCIGPVVGGWIAFKSGGYDWVFWFLFLVGACLLLAVGGFLPETARTVVGNGSVEARAWWERPWGRLLWDWSRATLSRRTESGNAQGARRDKPDAREGEALASSGDEAAVTVKKRFGRLNPLSCLRIIFWKDAAHILWVHGSFYMVDYSIQTSIPSSYKDIYHFNDLQIGLSYLPRGVGIILGGYAIGKLMDRNYRITARQIGHIIDRHASDDLTRFPIERARTRGSWGVFAFLTAVLIAYGWALDRRAHVSIPLLCQFAQGFLGTFIYTASNTLLVDVFPASPSTAAAAASIVRCALAALGVAVFQPLVGALGRGWYFSALGLGTGSAGIGAVGVIRARGAKWRGERVERSTGAAREPLDAEEMGKEKPDPKP